MPNTTGFPLTGSTTVSWNYRVIAPSPKAKGKSLVQLRGRVPHDLQDQLKTPLVKDALEC
jgi:hypothetical protein